MTRTRTDEKPYIRIRVWHEGVETEGACELHHAYRVDILDNRFTVINGRHFTEILPVGNEEKENSGYES